MYVCVLGGGGAGKGTETDRKNPMIYSAKCVCVIVSFHMSDVLASWGAPAFVAAARAR